jgi:hypothetical protein
MPRSTGQIELTLRTDEQTPFLADLLNFLYDFNLFYEISRLGTDPKYEGFRPSPWMFTRKRRTLEPEDRLQVDLLSQESPTTLIARITCTAAAITALGTLVRLPLAALEYQKLQLEIRNLQLDYQKRAKELGHPISRPRRTEDVMQRSAEDALRRALNRMEQSPVRIEEVGVRLITEENVDPMRHKKRRRP